MRPIVYGILAALFFAFTFILNRSMDMAGGSWIWSASLRYYFMVPFLLAIVIVRRNLVQMLREMKRHLGSWILWSSIGFGLFYAPICFSAAYAPGWLIAATWQITIISGSLLSPFFYETVQTKSGPVHLKGQIPLKALMMSAIILIGILLMQLEQVDHLTPWDFALGFVPIIVASFAYPLGNRKMMDVCGGRLDVFQRVLGMTLSSLPFWFILSLYGLFTAGAPKIDQVFQSLLVAISSGVIATVLFFRATDLVRGNMQKLAAVEATQSMEVLFAVLGELFLLKSAHPSPLSFTGMGLVMAGMMLHSYISHKNKVGRPEKISA